MYGLVAGGWAVLVIIIKELSYLSVNYGSWALPARINSGSF